MNFAQIDLGALVVADSSAEDTFLGKARGEQVHRIHLAPHVPLMNENVRLMTREDGVDAEVSSTS